MGFTFDELDAFMRSTTPTPEQIDAQKRRHDAIIAHGLVAHAEADARDSVRSRADRQGVHAMKVERSEIPGKFVAIPIGRFTREADEYDEILHLTDEEALKLLAAIAGFVAADMLAMLDDAHGKPKKKKPTS